MRARGPLYHLLIVSSLLILTACGQGSLTKQVASPAAPANTPEGEEPARTALTLAPTDVVLQYDIVPTFTSFMGPPEPWGHVPPLTLFADGTVIYLESDSTVMQAQLSADEMQALVNQVVALRFERLQTETDGCKNQDDGERTCVADASNTILRVRLPRGSLREVTIYAFNDQDPTVLGAITQLLDTYHHLDARPYQPTYATLFVRSMDPPDLLQPPAWPLSTDWLTPIADPRDVVTGILEGDELRTMLAATSFRSTHSFHQGTQQYRGIVIPWLPGADHHAAMAAFASRYNLVAPAGRSLDATPVP